MPSLPQSFAVDRTWTGCEVNPAALVQRMEEVYRDYPAALERGRRASERMHGKYTWAHTAEKFIAICEEALRRSTLRCA